MFTEGIFYDKNSFNRGYASLDGKGWWYTSFEFYRVDELYEVANGWAWDEAKWRHKVGPLALPIHFLQ